MTFSIDEMAPWMWVFIFILGVVILFSGLKIIYVWVAEDPCRAYGIVAHYWGRIGDHCVG